MADIPYTRFRLGIWDNMSPDSFKNMACLGYHGYWLIFYVLSLIRVMNPPMVVSSPSSKIQEISHVKMYICIYHCVSTS